MNRPLCKCHGVPMIRHDPRTWRCAIRNRVRNKIWYDRNHEQMLAMKAEDNMRIRGDRGAWMQVLKVTRVTEIVDGT